MSGCDEAAGRFSARREVVHVDLGAVDLNTLVPLRALLEEGNLTYAGAKVGMAQPAMSTILGRFRRHFDDELLVRVGRDFELTPLARELLPLVQDAVRRLQDALRVHDAFDPATSDRTFTVTSSDYAMTVLLEPLRRRVRAAAPHVRLDFLDMPDDLLDSPRALLRHDVVIGPLGFGIPGAHRFLFHDRLVCVVDPANPHLSEGGLDLDALSRMPHAVARFPGTTLTPVDRVLGQLGVVPRVAVQALGYLPGPFAIAGTDTVAVVPERLAQRFTADGHLVLVEPPFGFVDMLEAVWWHPSRDDDPAHRWLVGVFAEIADELAGEDPSQPSQAELADLLDAAERTRVQRLRSP